MPFQGNHGIMISTSRRYVSWQQKAITEGEQKLLKRNSYIYLITAQDIHFTAEFKQGVLVQNIINNYPILCCHVILVLDYGKRNQLWHTHIYLNLQKMKLNISSQSSVKGQIRHRLLTGQKHCSIKPGGYRQASGCQY